MPSSNLDYNVLAEQARTILDTCTEGNERVDGLFKTDAGYSLILLSLKKTAELASKKIRNRQKAQEFAVWFSNEWENRLKSRAPDKVVNLMRELCTNLLAPYKRLFFS